MRTTPMRTTPMRTTLRGCIVMVCAVVLSGLLPMGDNTACAAGDKKGGDKKKTAPVIPPHKGKRETIRPFNGRNLDGWTYDSRFWSVQDGVIVGRNTIPVKHSTYLLTKRKFSDFRLVFDFRLIQSEMHSGIALWGRIAPDKGNPYTYAGHLVMFPSGYGFYDLYGRNGLGVNNRKLCRKVGQQHGWNHIEILAQGNRIRFVLNGHLAADWREPLPKRIRVAPIGLQLHGNKLPQEVRFKNLVLETFPEDVLKTVGKGLH